MAMVFSASLRPSSSTATKVWVLLCASGAAEEGQQVVLEIMLEGTQTGELLTGQGTIPASGNRQRTPAAWIFDYQSGQLRESRHYFDMLTFLLQIGAAQLRQVVGAGL